MSEWRRLSCGLIKIILCSIILPEEGEGKFIRMLKYHHMKVYEE